MSAESISPVRRFLRSSGIMAAFYAGAMVFAFATGIVLTRSLGAYGYGVYSLAMTSATLIGLITEFGLPVLAMRETGKARATGNWGPLRGLLRWADKAIVLISLLLIAATYSWIAHSDAARNSDYLATMLWAVALLPLVGLGKLRSTVLMALDRLAAGQFAVMILRPLVFLALCLSLPLAGHALTPSGAMIAQVAGAAASLAMVAVLFRRWRPIELSTAKAEADVRGWLAACLPMGMTEGLRLLQGQFALLLTGWLSGAAAAGVYRGADSVLQLATVMASVAATAATPMFSRMVKEGDRTGIERVALLAAIAMAGGVLAISLPIAIFGYWLFPALFGHDFSASPPVFTILAGGLFFTYAMGLAQSLANMSGQHVLTTQSFLVTAAINLVLGFVLIPRHGPIGAAITTAVSASIGTAWCAWRLWQRTQFNTTIFNPGLWGIAGDIVCRCREAIVRKKGD